MTKRVLLAWEAGSGRGHLMTLRTVAQALGQSFIFDAALCRMTYAAELEPFCDLVFPASYLRTNAARRAARGNTATATWAEFLGDYGFADPGFLIRQIAWWIQTIKARRSALVICEFAPCAMLAAKIMGIPAVSLGTGYSTPPAGMRKFPVLLEEFSLCIHAEDDLLASLNNAIEYFGLPPVAHFSDLYACDLQLSRTIPALDPYASHRSGPYLPPFDLSFPQVQQTGDEVFCYFSTDEHRDPVLLEAISDLGIPTRLVMSQVSEEQSSKLQARGVIVETAPLTHDAIGARSRIMVHAGQHGSLCLGLALGLPQVANPRLLEQQCHVRLMTPIATLTSVLRHVRDPAIIRDAILAAYHDRERRQLAIRRSVQLRPQLVGDLNALVRQYLAPLLAA